MPYKYEPRHLTLQEVLKIEAKLLKNGKVEFRRGIDRTKRLATLNQGVWVDGVWNTSYNVGKISTSGDPGRAMMRMLHKRGIVCKRGTCYIDYDGSVYELCRRGTHEPYYAAIPMF